MSSYTFGKFILRQYRHTVLVFDFDHLLTVIYIFVSRDILDELRSLWETSLTKTRVCEVPEDEPEP